MTLGNQYGFPSQITEHFQPSAPGLWGDKDGVRYISHMASCDCGDINISRCETKVVLCLVLPELKFDLEYRPVARLKFF